MDHNWSLKRIQMVLMKIVIGQVQNLSIIHLLEFFCLITLIYHVDNSPKQGEIPRQIYSSIWRAGGYTQLCTPVHICIM